MVGVEEGARRPRRRRRPRAPRRRARAAGRPGPSEYAAHEAGAGREGRAGRAAGRGRRHRSAPASGAARDHGAQQQQHQARRPGPDPRAPVAASTPAPARPHSAGEHEQQRLPVDGRAGRGRHRAAAPAGCGVARRASRATHDVAVPEAGLARPCGSPSSRTPALVASGGRLGGADERRRSCAARVSTSTQSGTARSARPALPTTVTRMVARDDSCGHLRPPRGFAASDVRAPQTSAYYHARRSVEPDIEDKSDDFSAAPSTTGRSSLVHDAGPRPEARAADDAGRAARPPAAAGARAARGRRRRADERDPDARQPRLDRARRDHGRQPPAARSYHRRRHVPVRHARLRRRADRPAAQAARASR